MSKSCRQILAALFAGGVLLSVVSVEAERPPWDAIMPKLEEDIKDVAPKLKDMYLHVHKSEYQLSQGRPTLEERKQFAEFRNQPRDPAEVAYIVAALETAYAADPVDWKTVSVALRCAEVGVSDPKVPRIAESIVLSAHEMADDNLFAVEAAMRILALTGQPRYIEIVKSCTSREFLGITGDPNESYDSAFKDKRQRLRSVALDVLFECPPLDVATKALAELSVQFHEPEDLSFARPFDEYLGYRVNVLLEGLKRMKKGLPAWNATF